MAAGAAIPGKDTRPENFRQADVAPIQIVDFDRAFNTELKAISHRRDVIAKASGEAGPVAAVDKGPKPPRARSAAQEKRAEQEKLGEPGIRRGPEPALVQKIELSVVTPDYQKGEPVRAADKLNLTGLCMSGGGIRSAAINLGVVQALDALSATGKSDVIDRIDYLSTVSGGNYLGTSLAAGMMQPPGADPKTDVPPANRFPFESKTDGAETPETQHLRDYSSYLVPSGFPDYIANILIILRGLIANAVMILPVLLVLAVVTLIFNPTRASLETPLSRQFAMDHFGGWPEWAGNFVFSLIMLTGILVVMTIWTAMKRWLAYRQTLDRREHVSTVMVVLTFVTALVGFVEWQPALLREMFHSSDAAAAAAIAAKSGAAAAATVAAKPGASEVVTWIFSKLGQAGYVFGPAALGMLALGQKLINVAKAALGDTSFAGRSRRLLSKAGLLLLGVAVPMLLWIIYLNLTYAGVCIETQKGCMFRAADWMSRVGHWLPNLYYLGENPVFVLYAWVAMALVVLIACFSPNANSLHQMYRDRLSRAFLMERAGLPSLATSMQFARQDVQTTRQAIDRNIGTLRGWSQAGGGGQGAADAKDGERQVRPDDWTFSSLKPRNASGVFRNNAAWAPYLLVNTSINLQADYLNQRGRNADTFTLGALTCGSDATGYVMTSDMEDRHPRLTLASGLAISGAAASANMGSYTIPLITFSLAALNIRLGYWLPNPKRLNLFPPGAKDGMAKPPWRRWESGIGPWYFLRELFGRIDEKNRRVHLTDGGHIENLGLYELIKRRCRVIIAVDADADQGLVFSSLVKAQLMTRVDHGVRFELPWTEIAAASKVADEKLGRADEASLYDKTGPHVAVGRIVYRQKISDTDDAGEDVHGVIIYIKSSMTGDESDLLRDYKRRYRDFPHETTLDQFFSEEQFEVYRALGFHMAFRFFTGRDNAAFWMPDDLKAREEFFDDVRNALTSISVPAANVERIMARATAQGDARDKARRAPLQRYVVKPKAGG